VEVSYNILAINIADAEKKDGSTYSCSACSSTGVFALKFQAQLLRPQVNSVALSG